MGKKRGVKSWLESNEERKHEIYEAYSRQYDQRKLKGFRMTKKMDYFEFKSAYGYYYDESKQNVTRRIVKDQVDVSEKQAATWSRMARELAKTDERFKEFKTISSLSFKKEGKSNDFWALVNSLGGFKKVMYVDDDD